RHKPFHSFGKQRVEDALDDEDHRERRPEIAHLSARLSAIPGVALESAEEAEKVAVGREKQRRVLPDQRFAIGLERAVEIEELGILAERLGVDPHALPVALAAQDLRLALPVRDDDRPFALRSRADALREFGALSAELARFALALRLHARVDRLTVLLRQIGAADPDVEHVDPEGLRL